MDTSWDLIQCDRVRVPKELSGEATGWKWSSLVAEMPVLWRSQYYRVTIKDSSRYGMRQRACATDGRAGETELVGAQRIDSECVSGIKHWAFYTTEVWFFALLWLHSISSVFNLFFWLYRSKILTRTLPRPQHQLLLPGSSSLWILALSFLSGGLRCGPIAGKNSFLLKLLLNIAFIPATESPSSGNVIEENVEEYLCCLRYESAYWTKYQRHSERVL